MSIEYDRHTCEMQVECDHCERDPEIYDGDDWDEALAYAKLDGWRTFRDKNGDWVVKCPACVGYGVRPEEWDDD